MNVVRTVLLVGVFMTLGGCYYEVRDGGSGRMFYTEKWVAAHGYQGPLTFEDHTGVTRRIEHAQVVRINKNDYVDATAPEEEGSQP